MASGVQVDSKCVDAIQALVKGRKFRGAIFRISDDMSLVELEKTYDPSDASPKADWDSFTKDLPEKDCRYIVYDFSYAHQGATKQRVLFVLWSPEYSKVKSKMIYASSQEGVVNKIEGIQRQLQCTDAEDLEYDVVAKQLSAHTAGY